LAYNLHIKQIKLGITDIVAINYKKIKNIINKKLNGNIPD